jgi:hypothetical protein
MKRDRAAIALIVFYLVVGFTVELHWLLNYRSLPLRNDAIGRGWAFYGRADRGYTDLTSNFEIGLESFHIMVTLPLAILLLYGIRRRAVWRYPLQLAIGSYCCYSVALYLVAKHATGYAEMARHDLSSFMILYLVNLPWLAGMGWLALDAGVEISRRCRNSYAG